jgi:hypothetical protein
MKEWEFALPMATAILSVCWPDDFTVYEYRVRESLEDFPELNNLTDFEKIWAGYESYKVSVNKLVDLPLTLRDKDRFLWAQSAARQLEKDIQQRFRNE